MKLIVGLGNPGTIYENTRHNVGFMILDNYLSDNNWQIKFNALYTTKIIENEKIIFIKPQTFMNLSGTSVKEYVKYYKISSSDILVIQDDLDLPLGKIRIKINSSAGGHNGIKSIINQLGHNNFARLKIGISHNSNTETKDYVLAKFPKDQYEILKKVYPITDQVINDFIKYDISKVMNTYNGG